MNINTQLNIGESAIDWTTIAVLGLDRKELIEVRRDRLQTIRAFVQMRECLERHTTEMEFPSRPFTERVSVTRRDLYTHEKWDR